MVCDAAGNRKIEKEDISMRYIRQILEALMICFCLMLTAVPAQTAYAAAAQQAEVQTEGAQPAAEGSEDQDQETFFFIMMGGALLIIIVAVVAAVSTVSSSIAVAANMDVDGE